MTRIMRILRSRALALALILGISVYMGAVTAVPQEALSPQDHARWAAGGGAAVTIAKWIGLDHAFANGPFYLLCALLTAATAACAWERTGRAWKVWRRRGRVDARTLASLDGERAYTRQVTGERDDIIAAVAQNLRGAGYRVRAGRSLWFAERSVWGLAGSPLFHWGMVLLVLVVFMGRLTRWEGAMGVPEGGIVRDSPESYGRLDAGPLSMPHTGWDFRLTDVDEDMEMDGVHYGVTPRIALSSTDGVLAEDLVYANHPLRRGPLLIHLLDHGLNVAVSVTDAQGQVIGESDRLVDFAESTPSGTVPSGFGVMAADGSEIASVSVAVNARDLRGVLPRLLPPSPTVSVTVESESAAVSTTVVAVGESVPLPGGHSLRVADVGYYARLSVVRDWSAPVIFFLLGVLTLFLGMAMLTPYRHVWVRLAAPADGIVEIRMVAASHRRDPAHQEAISRIVFAGLEPARNGA